ncbi:hypothetical protein BUALT_Bualt02G0145600 [Buddleja alternifolia]|uniref:Uncharacterized protein n=1 Tax=Buddleja alternifolia TaxID=168488 RepID=A0AAV6Y6F7_9LAMI|nr:hypothetical protein BUALT_Bualt02G0145600 [Buddleja alternifolia]
MAPSTVSRWIRPELWELRWASAVFSWVSKEGRAAGVLENFEEGQKYSEHALRKFVRNRRPEIMPSINSFFTDPQNN